jgi:hypothetical protein
MVKLGIKVDVERRNKSKIWTFFGDIILLQCHLLTDGSGLISFDIKHTVEHAEPVTLHFALVAPGARH